MKKLLIFTVVTIISIGCNEKNKIVNKKEYKGIDQTRVDQLNTLNGKKLFEYRGNPYVVISQSKFDANPTNALNKYSNWKTKYSKYLLPNSLGISNCGTEKSHFNIIKYVLDNKDYTKVNFAKWLNENGNYICFDDMYPIIGSIHEINKEKHPEVIEIIEMLRPNVKDIHKLSIQRIRELVHQKGGDYDHDNYDHFLDFEFNWNDEITFNLSETYKPSGDYYSIPFIRSIYILNQNYMNETDNVLEFMMIPFTGQIDQIIISLKLNNGTYKYYDFSQIPPSSGGLSTYYNFSPL